MTEPNEDVGPVDPPVAHMPIQEFVDLGGVLEVNRLLLHPRGMALEWDPGDYDQAQAILDQVEAWFTGEGYGDEERSEIMAGVEPLVRDLCRPKGEPYLSGVWDDRADPLGTRYCLGPELAADAVERAGRFDATMKDRARYVELGYPQGVQPVDRLGEGWSPADA